MFTVEEQRKFYDFIFEKVESSFNKLQVIASTFSVQPKNFAISGE